MKAIKTLPRRIKITTRKSFNKNDFQNESDPNKLTRGYYFAKSPLPQTTKKKAKTSPFHPTEVTSKRTATETGCSYGIRSIRKCKCQQRTRYFLKSPFLILTPRKSLVDVLDNWNRRSDQSHSVCVGLAEIRKISADIRSEVWDGCRKVIARLKCGFFSYYKHDPGKAAFGYAENKLRDKSRRV